MYEWFYSFKKTFRLFLRRIYVSKKSNRERSLTRPLRESEASTKGRSRRSCIPNILIVSTIIVCYVFFLPSSHAPKTPVYSENSIETSVVFNPKQVQRIHIPKDVKVEYARKWLSRNKPEIVENETEANFITYAPTRNFAEQARNAPGNVIFIDDSKTSSTTPTTTELPKCLTRVSSEKLSIVTSLIKVSLENIYPTVQNGGYYKPAGCVSEHKVAILVPYRNRTRNLSNFLYNIHPFLMTQNLEYRIFVIEQFGNGKFNKGRLFNAGFKEMLKHAWWRCVVLHDVDLLPLDRRILYTCPKYPRHMSSYVIATQNRSRRNTSSPILFGGVTAMLTEHYTKANGHSNMYWGWGGEDYDMFWRIKAAMIPIVRYNRTIAKYLALPHVRVEENPMRYSLIRSAIDRWQTEGLSTVDYTVVSTKLHHLFTHILVDVQPWGETKGITSGLNLSKQLTKPNKEIVKHRRREPPPSPVIPSSNIIYRPPTGKINSANPMEPILAINPPLRMGNRMG